MKKIKMTDKQIENFISNLFEIYSKQIGVKIILKKKKSSIDVNKNDNKKT